MGLGNASARPVILVLAILGAAFVWLQLGRGEATRLSTWSGDARVSGATLAASANQGLSGMAQAQPVGRGLPGDLRPQGNPLQVANTVMTQGYGVGSHAPAEVWGGVDLAVDGNGDGLADPGGTWDHPVYATHEGVVKLTPDSWPGGNHVWITNEAYRSGYAHLSSFAVQDGQQVRRGDLIGYVGSTGMSSGPHLHYDTWVMENGAWVNVDPHEFGALDGTGR